MFSVYFFENKDLVLNQLLKHVPSAGDEIKIKGRKGKVLSVATVDDNKIYVQVNLEKVTKSKAAALTPLDKKKKR
ncbi:MAG TPA: hypothetical protein VNM69_20860 [Bacillus sp. (in: firmicutes)]|uniref:hypothetical protein n=1 Tax=Bacillus litorisediminis TaxID=2922713 RepID=UPI001FAD3253|nr:hypothetical protein [Bacillus litorisediminis]HWO78323.1 hypothetical protein [Bacillus sp. (in: firmicutes)]